jgi:NAD+ kinase
MKICVYSRFLKAAHAEEINGFFKMASNMKVELCIHKTLLENLDKSINIPRSLQTFNSHSDLVDAKPDFLLTLGGDGTILRAAALVRDAGIPIIGVNLGRLGFLASLEKSSINTVLRSLANNEYLIQERTMLTLESNLPLFEDYPHALNDCTILKRDTSSMITIHTYINGDFLNTYWSDGLIIATPTGSTGYSLSCGGPIIFPGSENLIITPVAPHNLNVRPIVISDDSVITLEVEGRAENFLCSLDSRHAPITHNHQIALSKCKFTTKLVQLYDRNFMQTLQEKLTWGLDARN